MPLNIDWQQILLHLLNFTILAFLLYMLLYSPIKKFMKKRQTLIADQQKEIETKMSQADQLKADYEQQLCKFNQEQEQLKQTANIELQQYREQQMKDAQIKAQKIVADAQTSAQAEKQKIISGASKEIKKLVVDATEKIVKNSTPSQSLDEFLKQAERGDKVEKAG